MAHHFTLLLETDRVTWIYSNFTTSRLTPSQLLHDNRKILGSDLTHVSLFFFQKLTNKIHWSGLRCLLVIFNCLHVARSMMLFRGRISFALLLAGGLTKVVQGCCYWRNITLVLTDPPIWHTDLPSEMQKVADPADISVLFFSAGANFWAILGHFWAILAILGHFWAKLGNFGSFLGYFG